MANRFKINGSISLAHPNPTAKLHVISQVGVFDSLTGERLYKDKTFGYVSDSGGWEFLYWEEDGISFDPGSIILIKKTNNEKVDRFIRLKSFITDRFSTRLGITHEMRCETLSNIEYLKEVHNRR